MAGLKVSHEDFVVAWATAFTIEDVMNDTHMTKPGVQHRAKVLKEAGVNLPKFPGRPGLDTLHVSQLNSLISKHKRGQS